MSIDTSVDGDPATCRRTARRLHGLHGQLVEARSYLHGQAHLAAAHFDGLSGDAYRARCAAIGRTVDAAADSSRGLARALDEYADGLDDVLAEMAGAREVARCELVLHGHVIPAPGGYATDRQRRLYRRIAGEVAAARGDEARLRDAWLGAIGRYAVGPVEDLCLPEVTTANTIPGGVVSRLVAGAPRTSTTVDDAPRTLTAVPFAARTSTTGTPSTAVPLDSVWVPWGGGDAA
ncbi:MAG TPA: hypothetical protein VFO49_19890 [Nocardioides sp.]|nr:hypothetical protein [Nocardioides sp.]